MRPVSKLWRAENRLWGHRDRLLWIYWQQELAAAVSNLSRLLVSLHWQVMASLTDRNFQLATFHLVPWHLPLAQNYSSALLALVVRSPHYLVWAQDLD